MYTPESMVTFNCDVPFHPAAVASVARFALVWLVEIVNAKALASRPMNIKPMPDMSGHISGDKAHRAGDE